MTKLAKYSQELYGSLEAETGVATGFKRWIDHSCSYEAEEEIFRSAAMARAFGVDIEEISTAEIGERYPHLNLDTVKAAFIWIKMVKGTLPILPLPSPKERQRGAIIQERVKVSGINAKDAV